MKPTSRVDPSRLAAQVISGVGFLGAGFITGALVCTFFVLISLYLLNKLEKHFLRHRRTHEVEIMINEHLGFLSLVASRFGDLGIQVTNLKMMPGSEYSLVSGNTGNIPMMHLIFSLRCPKHREAACSIRTNCRSGHRR